MILLFLLKLTVASYWDTAWAEMFEALLWRCHLYVHGLFSSSSLCLLAISSIDVSSQLMGWWFSHACSVTADLHPSLKGISVFPLSGLQSPFGPPNVNLATAAEECFNQDRGVELPGCWTALTRRQEGRSNHYRLYPTMTPNISHYFSLSPWRVKYSVKTSARFSNLKVGISSLFSPMSL